MREPFDIFIGGPMGGTQQDVHGLPFADHIQRLKAAVERAATEIVQENGAPNIKIYTPELDDSGMITSRVFGILDTAELGIMDVSAGSPSVMYELAMLHALGIPTIPVVMPDKDGSPQSSFYLQGTYQAVVESFEEEVLFAKLMPMIKAVIFGDDAGMNPAANPMSEYYGLPLVEASASTGLATGYFHNFMRHILKANGGVFDFIEDEVSKMVVIRPRDLEEAEGLSQVVQRKLKSFDIDVELIGERDGKVYQDREQARGKMLVFRAGGYLFDTPAPLAAQNKSPRMKRIRLMAERAKTDAANAAVQKFEQRMIDDFMATLARLPQDYPGSVSRRLDVATIKDFVRMVLASLGREIPDDFDTRFGVPD